MWLLDQWVERHISDAQRKGEFDNLPGSGEPLMLDDDSHIPLNYGRATACLKMQVVCLLSLSKEEKLLNLPICLKVLEKAIRNILNSAAD